MNINAYLNSLKTCHVNIMNPNKKYLEEFIKNRKQYDCYSYDYENIYYIDDNDSEYFVCKIDNVNCHFVKDIRCNYDYEIIENDGKKIVLRILIKNKNCDYFIVRYTGIILSKRLYEMFVYNLSEYSKEFEIDKNSNINISIFKNDFLKK
jgi:hypothetical protein